MLIFILFIISYITLYISRNIWWDNVKLYSPWGTKETIIVFIYLFFLFLTLNYILTKKNGNVDKFIYITTSIIFAFIVFSLSESTLKEAFILSSIVLFLLICNIILAFISKNNQSKIISIIPLIIYLYLYIWINEANNSYIN